ncbi:MAG: hypothetical protein E5W26_29765 [Mesorhizobium sp.]|nr:MAG: hypothetical protein E5W26_29765 [Mesorhizobium sp.]
MEFTPLAMDPVPMAAALVWLAWALWPIDAVLLTATPIPALVPIAMLSLPVTRLPAEAESVAS